jgi:hypothetical protein
VPIEEVPGWFARLVNWINDLLRTLASWGEGVEAAGFPLRWILIGLAVVALVHAAYQMADGARRERAEGERGASARELPRDEAWYWRRAEELARSGQYPGAMLAGFHAAMRRLEGRGAVKYRASATPHELLRTGALAPPLRAAFDPLVRELYRVAFAGEGADARRFTDWITTLRRTVDAPPR